jgi:TRAP-type C4-dicarboxylate transport system substrate-binding protein
MEIENERLSGCFITRSGPKTFFRKEKPMISQRKVYSIPAFWILALPFILTFLFAVPGPVSGASPILMKLSHQWAKDDLRDQWAHWFTKGVEEKTKGSVKFEIYPASALFKPHPQFDAMRQGALDLAVYHIAYAAGKVPETMITMMPCLPRNYQEAMKWRNAEIGKMVDKMCEDNGIKILSWGWMMGGIGSKKKLVALPTDCQGLKMRGAGKATEEMLRFSGASITSMPSTELYFALQTGVLDALMTTYSSFQSFRLYEVLDHLVVGRQNYVFSTLAGIVISNKTWAKLSPDQKKDMLEVGRGIEKKFHDEVMLEDEKAADLFSKKGVKIHYMTDAEFKAWEEASKNSAWKSFAEKVKGGKRIIDAAIALR